MSDQPLKPDIAVYEYTSQKDRCRPVNPTYSGHYGQVTLRLERNRRIIIAVGRVHRTGTIKPLAELVERKRHVYMERVHWGGH